MGYPLLCALGQAGHLSELRFPELESSEGTILELALKE
ncbi:hypothetical protein LEMLEM_LOCUS12650 [Lemmus lemmus]